MRTFYVVENDGSAECPICSEDAVLIELREGGGKISGCDHLLGIGLDPDGDDNEFETDGSVAFIFKRTD